MMWDHILLALTPYMLFVCLIGVTLGILWGAMPGLSTTMAMALLIGIYQGGSYGGAVAATMIGIPGTPMAAATMLRLTAFR